jgi:hypothetical protein
VAAGRGLQQQPASLLLLSTQTASMAGCKALVRTELV